MMRQRRNCRVACSVEALGATRLALLCFGVFVLPDTVLSCLSLNSSSLISCSQADRLVEATKVCRKSNKTSNKRTVEIKMQTLNYNLWKLDFCFVSILG